jgi:hypothetical protein
MKKIFLLSLLLLISSMMFAQPWLKYLPKDKPRTELTFFDYRIAFNQYWAPYNVDKGFYTENGVKKKAAGWKQFKRWEYEMESGINPTTGAFPVRTAQAVYEEYLRRSPASKSASAANWTGSGPNSSTGGYAGIGRISCVAFHPSITTTYWAGVASGGLWVTTNNGTSWACLTDNNGVLAVSDIAIPANFATSNTIYIATGDKDHTDNRSIGVLKSTNGGSTWSTTGISYALSEGEMVNRLLLDPGNDQTLIAATTLGVYKTTDGGANWSNQLTMTNFVDMEYKPGDFNTLYGSTRNGEIYVTTNGGTNWSLAFSDADALRIELAVSANQAAWVYAVAAGADNGLYGIFKSTNSGGLFSQVFSGSTKNLLGWSSTGSDSGGQGWYDLALAASPSSANTLLVGGVNTWRSTNGGTSWSIVSHWSGSGAPAVHADKHWLSFRSNGDAFECNDGGIYISTNNGTNWTDKTNGMAISQMYKLGVSQTVPDETVTGLQDNGTKLLSGGMWSDVKGGDGMECLIDYSDVDIQYGTYVYGQIDRTTDHWNSATDIQPWDAGDGAWVTPYIIDPANPQILYAGYADVWKTTNRGDSWTQISTSINSADKIRSMAIAPSNSQYLYVADYGHIWKTANGGSSWTDITGSLPVTNASIRYIAVKSNDPNTVWIAMSGYTSPGIYQSINGGTTWTSVSAGLPLIPVLTVVQNNQSTGEVQLYAGTELGVYFKKGTDNWVAYNTGLPNVKLGELEIYYAANAQNSKLRAATYGRGLWETPVYYSSAPMAYVSCTTTQNNVSQVAPGQVSQEIVGIQIVTTGDQSPLSTTSFTFSTTGSTNPGTDIANARVFYTGTSSSFAATAQFGTVSNTPNGTFTITGSQVLSGGTNYFWLAYDVPATAIIGNVLDAQCTALTVGTVKTPTVTNPAGSRAIGVDYCAAGSTATSGEYISNVTMGAVNQNSAQGTGGYQNFTSQVITMVIGASSTISVGISAPYSADELLIWVDWNKDGDFADAGENVYASGAIGSATFVTSFAPPVSATVGVTRMRIRLHDTSSGPNATPCGNAAWGEVEDYSVNVTGSNPCASLNYLASKAQSLPGTYVDLGSAGTLISTGNYDNMNSAAQNIGFSFDFNCGSFTQFVLNTNGFIKLGNTPPSSAALFFDGASTAGAGIFNSTNAADINLLSPFNHDLTSGTASPEYRVYTSGVAPDRICTIQFKNVREKTTSPAQQYNNMQFQVKLYESTNIIEFVYGDWAPSANASAFKTSACGLKGSGNSNSQLLLVNKGSTQTWDAVSFANANYSTTATLNFGNPSARPKPDAGRTYRFVPVYSNDLAVGEIYTLGEASLYHSYPQSIAVNIINSGADNLINIPVSLTLSGANSFTDTKIISAINSGSSTLVTFSDFSASANGATNIVVSVPLDEYTGDNTKTWVQSTTDYTCNYASTAGSSTGYGFSTAGSGGIFYAKYHATGTSHVNSVKAYIANDAVSVGQTVYGLVLDGTGTLVGQSSNYVIQSGDLGTWHTFAVTAPPTIINSYFYAGFAVTGGSVAYYAMGAQSESPSRASTWFSSAIDGSGLAEMDPASFPYRFMIGATFSAPAPVAGNAASNATICTGNSATITLSGYTGTIQWQQSANGTTGWANVSGGSGANAATYTTAVLASTTYYRAEVTQAGYTAVYSNVVVITVDLLPSAAGVISGASTVCQGQNAVTYSVAVIPFATSYIWTLPAGATGNSPTNTITVNYGTSAVSGNITVKGENTCGIGTVAVLAIVVNGKPATPVINLNGFVLHSNAASGNQWYNQNGLISGAVGQNFSPIINGSHYVVVTLAGCASDHSNSVNILFVGIEEASLPRSIKSYPNPVTNELILEFEGNARNVEFEIFNSLGQRVSQGDFLERAVVRTTDFAPGVYIIRFENEKGVEFRKIIKK